MSKTTTSRLFIISSLGDIEAWRSDFREDSVIFALTESAVDSLTRERISFCTLDDLLDEAYTPAIIFDKIRSLQSLCYRLDEVLNKQNHEISVKAFTHKLHSLRIPFFIYTYYIDHLLFLLKRLRPEQIYINYSVGDTNLADFAEILIGAEGLGCVVIKSVSTKGSNVGSPDWYQKVPVIKLLAKKLLRKSKYKSWSSLLSGLFRFPLFLNSKPNALVYTVDWEHQILLNKLREHFNFIFTEDLQIKNIGLDARKIDDTFQDLIADNRIKAMSYKGVPLLKFFAREIKKVLSYDWGFLTSTKNDVEKAFGSFNFKFFFSSYYLPQTEVITSLFNERCRPTYLMLHGGTAGIVKGVPYTPMSVHNEENDLSRLLVYGQSIVEDCEYVKTELPSFTTKVLSVGDAYFQKFAKDKEGNHKNGKLKVCYVFSGTGASNAMGKWGGCTDASLYEMRLRTLNLINQYHREDIDFVFKAGYGFENQNFGLIEQINSSPYCRLIGSSQKLYEFAEDFDLFLIEVPSTTILELMAMNKPIICLFDKKSMMICENIEADLLKTVKATFTRSEFLDEIETVLKNSSFNPSFAGTPRDFMHTFTGGLSPSEHISVCEKLILKETMNQSELL